jgi:hypothetical protein
LGDVILKDWHFCHVSDSSNFGKLLHEELSWYMHLKPIKWMKNVMNMSSCDSYPKILPIFMQQKWSKNLLFSQKA